MPWRELTEAIVEPLSAHHGSRHQPRIASHRRRACLSGPPLDVPPETAGRAKRRARTRGGRVVHRQGRALGAELQADKENLAAIVSICRRLDGIPLAIEFAAARTVMLRPAGDRSLLDDRFKLLTTGRRTALPRHQTLRATLDWSYDLLPEAEARGTATACGIRRRFTARCRACRGRRPCRREDADHVANLVCEVAESSSTSQRIAALPSARHHARLRAGEAARRRRE